MRDPGGASIGRAAAVACIVALTWLFVFYTNALANASGDPGTTAGEGLNALNLLPVLNRLAYVAGASSHSPSGMNQDSNNYLYQDAKGDYVMMEAHGPGVIDRFWTTGSSSASVSNFGNILIYFDGERTPRVDVPADTFFSGSYGPFRSPVCDNGTVSSGGFYCDVRMPFAKSVRVVSTGQPSYYNIGYETYPAGTPVQTFDPSSPQTLATVNDQVAVADRAGSDPGILPAGHSRAGSGVLAPGAAQVIANVEHPGTIRAIKVSVSPHDDQALQHVWLQARWDGSRDPAVEAPLADLFLSGAGERSPAKALLAGYLPASHSGYLYFPMPFARSARVRLVSEDSRPITATWEVQQTPLIYSGIGSTVGEFHATYAHEDPTQLGYDYTMLNIPGQGKVVGLSYTEQGLFNGSLPVFMEGNEHVYFDGSQNPGLNGTGTEDFFKAGYYYANGPFTLYDHGDTDEENASSSTNQQASSATGAPLPPDQGRTSQYRLMLQDPWNFRGGIVLAIQHGGGDGLPTDNHSVVFWYGNERQAMEKTDTIDLASPTGTAAANYTSTSSSPETLTAFYEGEYDGNIAEPAGDVAVGFPGAAPPPPGTDPRRQSVTDSGFTHPPGSTISLHVRIDPHNNGVLLRRRLDQATFQQQAKVLVDGTPAGIWFTPAATADTYSVGFDIWKRWADSDFAIPARLTAGKSRLSIELQVLTPSFVPSGKWNAAWGPDPAYVATAYGDGPLPDGWTDFRYTVFSITR